MGGIRRAVAVATAAVAALVGPPAAAAANPADPAPADPGPLVFDDGSAPTRAGTGNPFGKLTESILPDGSDGFLPSYYPSSNLGAYHLQLVDSGFDGDIEVLRPAAEAVAAELTALLHLTFVVDPGRAGRPSPGYDCGNVSGHACSLFSPFENSIGIIRIELSSLSACGQLAPPGSSGGALGCGGAEPPIPDPADNAFLFAGSVWLSPSLLDSNAPVVLETIAHEVGHALGLDHYNGRFTALPDQEPVLQLMYPSVHDDPSDTDSVYRSGDILGLWWLVNERAWLIGAAYRDFLGRLPDPGGVAFWFPAAGSPADFVGALASSDEWVGRILSDFYVDVFGRAPDPGGFAYWTGRIRASGVPAVAAALYGSDEYLARNGGSTEGFVGGMYRELLGRDPAADPAGVTYWVGESFRRGRTAVALDFFQSEEKRRARVTDLYCTLLDRPPDSGGLAYWAGAVLFQGDLALARNLASSVEYLSRADELVLAPLDEPPAPGC